MQTLDLLAHNRRISLQYVQDFRKQFDEAASHLQRVVALLLDGDKDAATLIFEESPVIRYRKGALVPQAYKSFGSLINPPNEEKPQKPNVLEADKFEVFRRDHYHCRYTGIRLITHPMIELLSYVLPDHFPYDNPPHGGDVGEKNTHLLVWALWPSVEHKMPLSKGGLNEMNNYTTANSKFNGFKGNVAAEHLGIEFANPEDKSWKGLEDEYHLLLELYREEVPVRRLEKLLNWSRLMKK